MKITKMRVRNFRLLRDATLNFKDDLSLLIGKNNSGKTSFIVALEKFFANEKFDLNDYPVCQRDKILNLDATTPNDDLAIQLIIQIKYGPDDNLKDLSELILDIDEKIDTVNAMFEYSVDKASLIQKLAEVSDKEKYLTNNLHKHTKSTFYVFEDIGNFYPQDRSFLVEKPISALNDIINLQIVHAKRNVSSSEETQKSTKVLSGLTTKFFNLNSDSSGKAFLEINSTMADMDEKLNVKYTDMFEPFLKNAKDFLSLTNLKVISDIQSNELVSYASRVVYGDSDTVLPEHLNGLGVMNILFLLLQIEMKKDKIEKEKKSINVLIIEEPEAHTHPQMQYVFATQIKKIIKDIPNLQTVITTHSSHIVSQCDFKDIRYLQKLGKDNVVIKDFYDELSRTYADTEHFNFLVKYLTLQSSELFFSDKIIFLEGATERILFPYFIRSYDNANDSEDIPLAAQHISIMEVGANARAFSPFLDFLGIKTLIVTDLDSTKLVTKAREDGTGDKITYPASPVAESTHTSNYTLKHFYSAPEFEDLKFSEWYQNLRSNNLTGKNEQIRVAYQTEEDGYHARSFEDAFLHINKDKVKQLLAKINGQKNEALFQKSGISTYELTNDVIEKKSDFASSLLYVGLTQDVEWYTPKYIKEALSWLAK